MECLYFYNNSTIFNLMFIIQSAETPKYKNVSIIDFYLYKYVTR